MNDTYADINRRDKARKHMEQSRRQGKTYAWASFWVGFLAVVAIVTVVASQVMRAHR